MQLEKHYITRIGWLRAAVLGANDGILSTTSLAIGVTPQRGNKRQEPGHPCGTGGGAGGRGNVNGCGGIYFGKFSCRSDIETADLKREKKELGYDA